MPLQEKNTNQVDNEPVFIMTNSASLESMKSNDSITDADDTTIKIISDLLDATKHNSPPNICSPQFSDWRKAIIRVVGSHLILK